MGLVRRDWGALLHVLDQDVDLSQGETGELDVKLDIDESLQLDCEYFPIPAGILRKLVVGDDIGTSLALGEV